ncbi:MAG: DEAD/DEAH box helicase, partial [Chloroflexi bacterium]|nr:DEAD/DEAH box helicase [Chloroflexota bacterium]
MLDPPALSTDALVAHLRHGLGGRRGRPDDILVHEERIPARAATGAVLRPRLPEPLGRALWERGFRQLYTHQVDAIQAARRGENVVVTTPTASGKTLCFNLPVIERLLRDPAATALYLYPTKALMADQLRGLETLLASLEAESRAERPIRVAILSGDVPADERERLCADPPAILIANPDILHFDLLLKHRRWERFLANLAFVVLDELHAYRGVFGSHVGLILRRLRRLVARDGAAPAFIAASATIANPGELAERLVGLPFSPIAADGAGTSARRFLFWRPPLQGSAELNEHHSATAEAVALFVELIRKGRTVILFGRSRTGVERMLAEAREELGPDLGQKVSGYKAGYTPEERGRIEADLREGRLRGVVATNALELGIDIGTLDAAVLAGYPGTV